jgi:hypothetical protein
MGLIARWRERREIRRKFREYISPEAIRQATADFGKSTFKRLDLSFILVEFRDTNPERTANDILQLRRIVLAHNGTPWSFISSTGLIAFGDIFEAPAHVRAEQSKQCAEALLRAFKENIKIVYGQSSAVLAHVLEDMNSHFGPIIPGLSSAMSQLGSSTFGSATEAKIPTAAP